MSKWKEYQIGDFAELQGGFAFSSNFFRDNGIPLIRISNISNKGIYKNFAYLPQEFLDKHITFSVNIKDIVIAMSGATTGKNCLIIKKNMPALVNQRVGRFIIKKKEIGDNDYLYFFVNTAYFQNEILIDAIGGAQPNISSNQIEKIKINLPSLSHQRKIARILTTIDNVIEKTDSAIAKYKAIKQGMMHDLFTRGIKHETGKLRPTKEEAPHLYKKTELGWIPKEWEVEMLVNVVALSVSNVDKKSRNSEQKVFLCNYMDVYENNCITNKINFMEATAPLSQIYSFKLEIGDVLITKDSEVPEDIAVPSVVKEIKKNLLCGYHLAILRTNTESLLGEYLYFQLNLEFINKHFYQHANGSTRYGLTKDSIYNAKIFLSKKEEQKEIIKKLLVLDNKIETEQKQLSKLQKLKQGLMQDLLTGKKEVEPDKEDYDE